MTAKKRVVKEAPSRPDPEVVSKYQFYIAIVNGLKVVLGILAFCVIPLACVPLADKVAGTDTSFNFTVSIGLSVIFGGSALAAGGYGAREHREANRLRRRNAELEQKLKK